MIIQFDPGDPAQDPEHFAVLLADLYQTVLYTDQRLRQQQKDQVLAKEMDQKLSIELKEIMDRYFATTNSDNPNPGDNVFLEYAEQQLRSNHADDPLALSVIWRNFHPFEILDDTEGGVTIDALENLEGRQNLYFAEPKMFRNIIRECVRRKIHFFSPGFTEEREKGEDLIPVIVCEKDAYPFERLMKQLRAKRFPGKETFTEFPEGEKPPAEKKPTTRWEPDPDAKRPLREWVKEVLRKG